MRLVIDIAGGLLFFALILVSIGLHELGHFIPGKLFNVKVVQFFIGFGKNLWKTKRGDTEYGVKMIPLGGYVRLLGAYPPKKPGKDTWLKRVADGAREAEWQEITAEDVASGRLLYQAAIWKRVVIMACGVIINLLLAFALFLGVNLAWGQYEPSMTVQTVSDCAAPAPAPCVAPPAAVMGLEAGDTVTSFNGTAYTRWADLTAAVRANRDGLVQLTVLRDGRSLALPAVAGMIATVADPNDTTKTIQAGFLGVTADYERVQVGPIGTLKQMGSMIGQSVVALAKLPVSAYKAVVDMITGTPRDLNSPISIVGASVIAGQIAGLSGVSTGDKVASYISLLAGLNLFVGLMNLVPLVPFDGGQVAAGVYEAIRRGWAKARHRPDPGPADTAKLLPVAYIVGGLLVVIGAILIVADIIAPVAVF